MSQVATLNESPEQPRPVLERRAALDLLPAQVHALAATLHAIDPRSTRLLSLGVFSSPDVLREILSSFGAGEKCIREHAYVGEAMAPCMIVWVDIALAGGSVSLQTERPITDAELAAAVRAASEVEVDAAAGGCGKTAEVSW